MARDDASGGSDLGAPPPKGSLGGEKGVMGGVTLARDSMGRNRGKQEQAGLAP